MNINNARAHTHPRTRTLKGWLNLESLVLPSRSWLSSPGEMRRKTRTPSVLKVSFTGMMFLVHSAVRTRSSSSSSRSPSISTTCSGSTTVVLHEATASTMAPLPSLEPSAVNLQGEGHTCMHACTQHQLRERSTQQCSHIHARVFFALRAHAHAHRRRTARWICSELPATSWSRASSAVSAPCAIHGIDTCDHPAQQGGSRNGTIESEVATELETCRLRAQGPRRRRGKAAQHEQAGQRAVQQQRNNSTDAKTV